MLRLGFGFVVALLIVCTLAFVVACVNDSPRPPGQPPGQEASTATFDRIGDVVARLDTFARGAERLATTDPQSAAQWLKIAGGVRAASNIIAVAQGGGYDAAVQALLEVTGQLGGRYALYAAGAALVLDLLRPYDAVHPPGAKALAAVPHLQASAFEHVLADAATTP